MQSDPAAAQITLRRATQADVAALIQLIVALAHFEKLTPPDAAAQHRLIEHGFGEKPRFESWLGFWADVSEPVAYAMVFETYSSFEAQPTLYLEDIFVLPEFRHRGIGAALLDKCVQLAEQRGCARMEWTCLDWNHGAQATYQKLGARKLSDWILYRLDREAMTRHLGKGPST